MTAPRRILGLPFDVRADFPPEVIALAPWGNLMDPRTVWYNGRTGRIITTGELMECLVQSGKPLP